MTTMTTKQDTQGRATAATRHVAPAVEVNECGDGYKLQADMPGVDKDGLEILLEDNELTIMGRRQPLAEGGEFLYRESNDYGYRRTFELDPTIDRTGISARIENGVLTVTLPKAEEVKPRRIEVMA